MTNRPFDRPINISTEGRRVPHEFDDHDDRDDASPSHRRTAGDLARYLLYTLLPTLYTDEHSATNDLLWQQVLEQRGIRAWLAVIGSTLLGLLVVAVIALVTT